MMASISTPMDHVAHIAITLLATIHWVAIVRPDGMFTQIQPAYKAADKDITLTMGCASSNALAIITIRLNSVVQAAH